MSDIKWIKIITDIFDDEKILLIEEMPVPQLEEEEYRQSHSPEDPQHDSDLIGDGHLGRSSGQNLSCHHPGEEDDSCPHHVVHSGQKGPLKTSVSHLPGGL